MKRLSVRDALFLFLLLKFNFGCFSWRFNSLLAFSFFCYVAQVVGFPFCVKLYPQIKVEAVLFFFLIKLTYRQLLPYKFPNNINLETKKLEDTFLPTQSYSKKQKKKRSFPLGKTPWFFLHRVTVKTSAKQGVLVSCPRLLQKSSESISFFFFSYAKEIFQLFYFFFFFLWAGHKFDELSKTQNQWVEWEFNVT